MRRFVIMAHADVAVVLPKASSNSVGGGDNEEFVWHHLPSLCTSNERKLVEYRKEGWQPGPEELTWARGRFGGEFSQDETVDANNEAGEVK